MDDIREACDLMQPVWERTGGIDGWVSLEVDPDPRLRARAHIRAGGPVRTRRSSRPNLYVKIPATEPGLGAIEDCIAKGVSINVTLIFSLERYAAVAEAYLRGLERLVAAGGDPRHGAVRRELLRLTRRHRGRQAAGRGRAPGSPGKARDRERQARLPALPRALHGAAAGPSSQARAPVRSAASGPRPRRRTLPIGT